MIKKTGKVKFIWLALIINILIGCSKLETLNLESHQFGEKPTIIVWYQIAGFSMEHLAMLRFGMGDVNTRTSMEETSCVGNAWNYNLYNLRPDPFAGFFTQLVGGANVKNNCEDFKQMPLWEYVNPNGLPAGMLESGTQAANSMEKAWDCGEDSQKFREKLTLWKMQKNSGKPRPVFHYQGREEYNSGEIYYDKSCQIGNCYASLSNNIEALYKNYAKGRSRFIFIVRDFSYYNALMKKNVSEAREILSDLEKSFREFMKLTEAQKDLLLVLTSSTAYNFEFPKQGKEWADFEKNGAFIVYRNSALLSPVLAKGPASENFCGVYQESEIMQRFLWLPKARKLSINPFDWF